MNKPCLPYTGSYVVPDLVFSDVIRRGVKMSFIKYKSSDISCFSHCLKAKSNLLAHENLCLLYAFDHICSHSAHLSAPVIVLMAVSIEVLTHSYPPPPTLWGWASDIVLASVTLGEITGVELLDKFFFWLKKSSLSWKAFCPLHLLSSSHLKPGEAAIILSEATRIRNNPTP